MVSPLFRWTARLLDQAVAWYLSEHVTAGYKFLMQNYNVGDKVCIFGPSGAHYGPSWERLTCSGFIDRFLPRRVYCSSAGRDVVQGLIHYPVPYLFLILTRLA